jgi:hypothetical protein
VVARPTIPHSGSSSRVMRSEDAGGRRPAERAASSQAPCKMPFQQLQHRIPPNGRCQNPSSGMLGEQSVHDPDLGPVTLTGPEGTQQFPLRCCWTRHYVTVGVWPVRRHGDADHVHTRTTQVVGSCARSLSPVRRLGLRRPSRCLAICALSRGSSRSLQSAAGGPRSKNPRGIAVK